MSNIKLTAVDTVIKSRKATRAFKKDPVDLQLVSHILEVASRAPSGSNMQPWNVYVLTGDALKKMTDAVCHVYDSTEPGTYKSEYQYYPERFFEPYLARRRKMGIDMYGILGIGKGEKEKTIRQQRRNYQYFDAPVGLIFTMHRELPLGCLIEYGMFIDNIMLSAKSHGLDTCPQGGWSDYHDIIRTVLPVKPEEMILGGMAIGYADKNAPVYNLETEREPVSGFARFFDK